MTGLKKKEVGFGGRGRQREQGWLLEITADCSQMVIPLRRCWQNTTDCGHRRPEVCLEGERSLNEETE